ncbi:DUF4342 domain-containing protein [Chloroflexota bacterium]
MAIKEKFTVSGDKLLGKVKQLIREGNIRKVRIIQKDKVLLEVPLTIGAPAAAIGIVWLPVLAAVGALAALVTECTIEVERLEKKDSGSQEDEK